MMMTVQVRMEIVKLVLAAPRRMVPGMIPGRRQQTDRQPLPNQRQVNKKLTLMRRANRNQQMVSTAMLFNLVFDI